MLLRLAQADIQRYRLANFPMLLWAAEMTGWPANE
jgi:hypothetical protein